MLAPAAPTSLTLTVARSSKTNSKLQYREECKAVAKEPELMRPELSKGGLTKPRACGLVTFNYLSSVGTWFAHSRPERAGPYSVPIKLCSLGLSRSLFPVLAACTTSQL